MRQHEQCYSRWQALAQPSLGRMQQAGEDGGAEGGGAAFPPSKANGQAAGGVNQEAGSEPGKTARNDLLYRFFESDFFDAWIALT